MMQHHLKRIMDALVAIILLCLTCPLLVLAMLAIRWSMGSPVLFRHTRPGLHGKPFTVFKLRTMSDARDVDGKLLPADLRLTRLGRLLRNTSLDELPQLWNILKGEMSLVGPRPLLMEYLERYTPEQARRHEVRPGITGLAQVHGRNAMSWDERFKLDVWYIDHWSLWLDFKILLLTLIKVIKREGVNFSGNSVSSPFKGNS